MTGQVTHRELDEVRRELHNDHGNLAEKLEDVAVRIHVKLDRMDETRVRTVRWLILFTLSLFTTIFARQWWLHEEFSRHLEHSATYTEKILDNEKEIDSHMRDDH